MNRKQIVNENLQWPEIDETQSVRILDALESHLKRYPELKRPKNPPKKVRLRRQQNKNKSKEGDEEMSEKPARAEIRPEAEAIKKRLRIGINVVTKTLEREPDNVMFVLVCRSCRPLGVLTRHVQVMCAMQGIPAGCVHNLSSRLERVLNIGSIRALLVRKSLLVVQPTTGEVDESILKDWRERIVPLLPVLKNPFGESSSSSLGDVPSGGRVVELIEEIKREWRISSGEEHEEKEKKKGEASRMEVAEEEADNDENEFGDDYLRIRGDQRDHVKWLDFDNDDDDHHDTRFILFNDAYQRRRRNKQVLKSSMDF